ncbi:MAG: 30S ribosomal protein S1 [candidate division WWE3 bacterium GW2011_GWB1_42_6]|uniref:Small ribosomal subunit protein uS4 n=1 Tax=candidate division WWE3 bacterium GW2011_GWB1_42_6 TaxID=1619115 RepID=A0A0G1DTS2_UNCKA|nr:MAG: 30S ribosomal protein S1 [candidate division WWE3 bacterium GW2011_GWB1_42_6]
MGRYTGPKDRLSRREGVDLFGKGGKLTRLNVPPGIHGPRGFHTKSQYGRQLREKQKVKRMYGLMEHQFKNYVQKALKSRGNTGEMLLSLLERRLDNVIYRLGFSPTRSSARQLVSHRQILVDGKRVNIPSCQLKVGDTILAKVVQSENQQGYIVLSLRKAEKDKKWKGAEDALASGSILEATIIEYNKGGLLCDCLGLRGFIPLSHLDRSHFANDIAKFAAGSEAELKESLKALAGKVIKVKVIELDPLKNRFVLSEKDAMSTYSDESREKRLQEIASGTTLEGIVTGIMPFGVFIDLDGVEGLVHISEIAWEKVNNPSAYFSVGKTVKVMVLGIDEQSKKLALSVKRLTPNPWETVEKSYPVGTKVKGIVSKVVPFGAFVTIEKGLDGLVHVSEAAGPLKEGEEVEAIVIQVDGTNQKLALSTRQQ